MLPAWELTRHEDNVIRRASNAAYDTLFLPMHRLQESDEDLTLSNLETLNVIWGAQNAALGHMQGALSSFEQRLLRTASRHCKRWHACILLWCALCRLYACDPQTALGYASMAKDEDLAADIPEFELMRGIALRLTGDPQEAMRVLEPLCGKGAGLFPHERMQAIACRLESMAFVGMEEPDAEQVKEMDRNDRNVDHGGIALLPAALYRLSVSGSDIGIERTSEQLLAALDAAPAFQRPMITMLLDDILPRPLAGVQPATRTIESFWE